MRRRVGVVVAGVVLVAFATGIAVGRHGSTKNASPSTTTKPPNTAIAPVLPLVSEVAAAVVPLSVMPGGTVEVAARERRISCTRMGFAARSRAVVTYRKPDGELLTESVNVYREGLALRAMNFVRKQWSCKVATDAQHRKWSVAPLSYTRIASDQATYRIKEQANSAVVEDVIVLRVNDSTVLVIEAGVNDDQIAREAYAWARYKLGG